MKLGPAGVGLGVGAKLGFNVSVDPAAVEHTVENVASDVGNVASDVGHGIANAASDVGHGISNAASDVGHFLGF